MSENVTLGVYKCPENFYICNRNNQEILHDFIRIQLYHEALSDTATS